MKKQNTSGYDEFEIFTKCKLFKINHLNGGVVQRNVKSQSGFTIGSTDGEIGKVVIQQKGIQRSKLSGLGPI